MVKNEKRKKKSKSRNQPTGDFAKFYYDN